MSFSPTFPLDRFELQIDLEQQRAQVSRERFPMPAALRTGGEQSNGARVREIEPRASQCSDVDHCVTVPVGTRKHSAKPCTPAGVTTWRISTRP